MPLFDALKGILTRLGLEPEDLIKYIRLTKKS